MYVGTLMSPMKPLVEVTGPEKVVDAIVVPFAQGFASQSVQRQEGGYLSAKLMMLPCKQPYTETCAKRKGLPKQPLGVGQQGGNPNG